MSEEV